MKAEKGTKEKHIVKLTVSKNKYDGYRVAVRRDGKTLMEYFSASKLGWPGALEEARAYRERLYAFLGIRH